MNKIFRTFLSGTLLVSSLVLLTGCGLFDKGGCSNCKPGGAAMHASAEDVLLSINGTPLITKEQFEDFYEVARSNAGPYGAIAPRDAWDMMVKMAVLDWNISQTGKDKTDSYRKDFDRAFSMARWGVNSQLLANEIKDKIDVSDSSLEAFYNEKRGKDQNLDRPPFLKSHETTAMKSVEFSDKAAAEAFFKKAKTDFEGAAKAGNLTVKNLGNVSTQSRDVDFSVCLRARTMKPGDVELIQSVNKWFVAKAGTKVPAKYAEFSEIKDMPGVKDMLSGYKQKIELEPAFVNAIDEYKKGLTLVENTQYFDAQEAQQKAEEEKVKEMIAEQMKQQESKGAEKSAEKAAQPAAPKAVNAA